MLKNFGLGCFTGFSLGLMHSHYVNEQHTVKMINMGVFTVLGGELGVIRPILWLIERRGNIFLMTHVNGIVSI